MKKIKTQQGYVAFAVSVVEVTKLGGIGVCDHCNEGATSGYLVPVLNHYLCPKCFRKWEKHATYYHDDIFVEQKNAKYYEHIINQKGILN